MEEQKKDLLPQNEPEKQEPQKEPYIPASRSKRIAAWIGVFLMVLLVILYTYSMATGAFVNW